MLWLAVVWTLPPPRARGDSCSARRTLTVPSGLGMDRFALHECMIGVGTGPMRLSYTFISSDGGDFMRSRYSCVNPGQRRHHLITKLLRHLKWLPSLHQLIWWLAKGVTGYPSLHNSKARQYSQLNDERRAKKCSRLAHLCCTSIYPVPLPLAGLIDTRFFSDCSFSRQIPKEGVEIIFLSQVFEETCVEC